MKPRPLNATLTLAFCLACAMPACAQQPSNLPTLSVDPVKLLPGPPAAGSAEAREELELMETIQHDRTKADVDRCASEVTLTVDAFQSALGPWCTSGNLPKVAKLFKDLAKATKPISSLAKDHFKRPRPAREDAQIKVPIEDESTFAYPSGHSTRGTMYALILAELLPAHRDAILQRGRDIGWDRVVAGLHHPTDIYAGRVLGQALADSLLANPKFREELAPLKKELSDAEQHAAEPRPTAAEKVAVRPFDVLKIESGDKPSIHVRVSSIQGNPHELCLLTVKFLAADSDESLGVFQRFQEATTHVGPFDAEFKLPAIPKDAAWAQVFMEVCEPPAEKNGASWNKQWYDHTWSHFTTARRRPDGWSYFISTEPMPSDLVRWAKESGIEFVSEQAYRGVWNAQP